jgi:hypothetical protein
LCQVETTDEMVRGTGALEAAPALRPRMAEAAKVLATSLRVIISFLHVCHTVTWPRFSAHNKHGGDWPKIERLSTKLLRFFNDMRHG